MAGSVVRSVIVVPFPEAHALVAPWRRSRALDAHVTLVVPFVEPEAIDGLVVERLAASLTDERAFDVTFGAIGWFAPRVVYAAPDDPQPFEHLSRVLADAFAGDLPTAQRAPFVAHLTIAAHRPFDELVRAAADAAEGLPLSTRARGVDLFVRDTASDSWRLHSRVSLAARFGG